MILRTNLFKPKRLIDLFTPHKVFIDESVSEFRRRTYAESIMFALPHQVPHEALPYANTYTPDVLKDAGVTRINQTIVVARADRRSPEEILEAGGFHPQATNPKSTPKCNSVVLDVTSHRMTAAGSGLVSFSSSMRVAKSTMARFVYLAKTIGAISHDEKDHLQEFEYSVPGGVDASAIIAFHPKVRHAPIFLCKAFEEAHPDKIACALSAFLAPHQYCERDGQKITQDHILNEALTLEDLHSLPLTEANRPLVLRR